jgi:hypothetical protein
VLAKAWWARTPPYVTGLTLKWLKVKQLRDRERERGWEPKK